MREDRGVKCVDLDVAVSIPAPEDSLEDPSLPRVWAAVRATFDQLAVRVKDDLHPELYELLSWLAINPPRISYEGLERVAAHRTCPSFTIEQVKAVMNIAWGGRPRQGETSLLGQYLKNPHFRPSESPTHARALTYFKNEFRAGEQGSRMLTDWNAA
jgi:hypothetical protein